jgi:hypothetical protein
MDSFPPSDEDQGAPGTGELAVVERDDPALDPATTEDRADDTTDHVGDGDRPVAPGGGSGGAGSGDGGGDAPVPSEPLVPIDDPAHSGRSVAEYVSWAIVALCCIVVFATLHPEWILRSTTPTGGDMGAHVWGPAFLRDHLLPQFRLTGWTPDWYAGFPAYVFYMVIPSLAVVIINVGPPLWATPFLLAAIAAAAWWVHGHLRSRVLRTFLWTVLGLLAVLSVPVPYEVAFKLVTVSGLVTLPLAAFALARSAKVPFPGPPIVAVGAAAYLYETGFTILGGNIASTMAGEFAFSISLTFAFLYLAVLLKGMRTNRQKALGALLFALVVLCHIIPAMFVIGATIVVVFTRREDRVPWWDASTVGRGIATGIVLVTLLTLVVRQPLFPYVASVAAVALFVAFDLRALKWAAVAVPVGGLVAAFWVLPFYADSPFMNDMGWEKYTDYAKYLWPTDPASFDMRYRNVVFALAGLGIILAMVHRMRLGWYLTLLLVGLGWAFRFAPQWRLWNARILPFYYLCLYLLAALAVALVIRSVALVVGDLRRAREEPVSVSVVGAIAVVLVVLIAIGGALHALPGGQLVSDPAQPGQNDYRWPVLGSWRGLNFGTKQNIASSWALYNYQGLEERPAYPEFSSIMDMMRTVGKEHGCGRAMWEYEPKLDRFGTPMALMLLPYFTDECIGSMEGLYFEASSTTPFHFLNQSELSVTPSRAQRDLPYGNFDLDLGISHLQMLGVKYYMATTQQAIDAARKDPRLTELASVKPKPVDGVQHQWVVFEVADTKEVVPLEDEPVVLKDTDDHIDGWVYGKERPEPAPGQEVAPKTAGPATTWYLDPDRWSVPLATSGPANWARVSPDDTNPPKKAVPKAKVSNVHMTDSTISFDVDRVGTPIEVRTSFFPNWQASGATGPYRVSPNQMVVVPTSKHVELSYGTTNVDRLAWLLTFIGLGLVGLIAVREERADRAAAAAAGDLDGPGVVADGAAAGDGDSGGDGDAPDGRDGDGDVGGGDVDGGDVDGGDDGDGDVDGGRDAAPEPEPPPTDPVS